MWRAAIEEMLEPSSDDRKEAKEYNKYAVGLCKKAILVGHIPREISSYLLISSIKIQGTK